MLKLVMFCYCCVSILKKLFNIIQGRRYIELCSNLFEVALKDWNNICGRVMPSWYSYCKVC